MATEKEKSGNAYAKIENLVMEKLFTLEAENSQLKTELAIANAKLEIYERIASVSDSKVQLGFGPPIMKEGGIQ